MILVISAVVSAATFAIIIGTERLYGNYLDQMWQETLKFIPLI